MANFEIRVGQNFIATISGADERAIAVFGEYADAIGAEGTPVERGVAALRSLVKYMEGASDDHKRRLAARAAQNDPANQSTKWDESEVSP